MTIQCTDPQRTITTFFTHCRGYQLSVLLEKLTCKIIDVCMRLHNFIVHHRGNNDKDFSTSVDHAIFDDDSQ